MSLRALGLLAFVCTVGVGASAAEPRLEVERGELEGARYAIARPANWNGNLLLVAHAARPVDKPLIADIATDRLLNRTLLGEGWMVACTSFRRNGIIIADAIEDLDRLRHHVEQIHGKPTRVILEGEAMSGLTAVIIAERSPVPARYDAVIAIGPTLHLREPNAPIGISLQPAVPLILVATTPDVEAARQYVFADVPRVAETQPVLLKVARAGHANVNDHERLRALRIAVDWLDRGDAAIRGAVARAADGVLDITITPPPQPSLVNLDADGRGFASCVISISGANGQITLDAQPSDFAAVGIERMTWFQLTINAVTTRALYARDVSNVKRGEWVLVADADGFTTLSRHYGDAAGSANVSMGDRVLVRRFPRAGAP